MKENKKTRKMKDYNSFLLFSYKEIIFNKKLK